MNSEQLKKFAIDFMVLLTEINSYPSLRDIYPGIIVYENKKIDLADIFFCGYLGRYRIEQRTEEFIQEIESFSKYLEDREEDSFIRKDEKPIAYIQMREEIWDALYWGCREQDDPKMIRFIKRNINKFMKEHNTVYDLTQYGRNGILVYYHGED